MVELRYFGGLGVDEVADVLNVSTDTVTCQELRESVVTKLFEHHGQCTLTDPIVFATSGC